MTPGARCLALAALAALAGLVVPRPLAAEVTWEIRHAAGGIHRPGGLVPISVRLTNPDRTEERVRLGVSLPQASTLVPWATFHRSVDLPPGVRKELTLFVAEPVQGSTLPVEILGEGAAPRRVGSVDVTSLPVSPVISIVAVVGPSLLGWGELRGDPKSRLQVVSLRARDLPDDPTAYEALDVVVVPPAAAQLVSPEAWRSLSAWQERGGNLVVSAAGPPLPAMLGVTAETTAALSFPGLAATLGSAAPRPPQPVAVAGIDCSGPDCTPLVREAWGPFIVRRSRGAGTIVVLGFDPGNEAFAGWTSLPRIWRRLLASMGLPREDAGRPAYGPVHPPNYPAYRPTFASLCAGGLQYQSAGTAPRRATILSLLVLYLLVIGPFEYLFLRRAGRLALTWVSYPLTVLAVTVLAWSLSGRGLQTTLVRHATLADLLPSSGLFADEIQVAALAPRTATYRLGMVPGGGIGLGMLRTSSGSTFRVDQGLPQAESMVPRGAWGVGGFRRFVETRASVTAELVVKSGEVHGRLELHLGGAPVEARLLVQKGDALLEYRPELRDGENQLRGVKLQGFRLPSMLQPIVELALAEPGRRANRLNEQLWDTSEDCWRAHLRRGGAVLLVRLDEETGPIELSSTKSPDTVRSRGRVVVRVALPPGSVTVEDP